MLTEMQKKSAEIIAVLANLAIKSDLLKCDKNTGLRSVHNVQTFQKTRFSFL